MARSVVTVNIGDVPALKRLKDSTAEAYLALVEIINMGDPLCLCGSCQTCVAILAVKSIDRRHSV